MLFTAGARPRVHHPSLRWLSVVGKHSRRYCAECAGKSWHIIGARLGGQCGLV